MYLWVRIHYQFSTQCPPSETTAQRTNGVSKVFDIVIQPLFSMYERGVIAPNTYYTSTSERTLFVSYFCTSGILVFVVLFDCLGVFLALVTCHLVSQKDTTLVLLTNTPSLYFFNTNVMILRFGMTTIHIVN